MPTWQPKGYLQGMNGSFNALPSIVSWVTVKHLAGQSIVIILLVSFAKSVIPNLHALVEEYQTYQILYSSGTPSIPGKRWQILEISYYIIVG